MFNNFQILGRIATDPELRTTPNGIPVATFRVAVERRFKPKDSERVTDFFNVVAWRGTGEFICKFFGKGRMIFLEGEMQIRPYTDKKGNTAYCYEIIADRVSFTGERADSTPTSAPVPAPEQPESLPEYQPADGSDDYPF